jgi:CopA family copper-resistance protein
MYRQGGNAMNRADVLRGLAALGVIPFMPGMAAASNGSIANLLPPARDGERSFDFTIDSLPFFVDGRRGNALTVNGSIPAPLLRAREGETLIVRVTNRLKVLSSIHWHGLLIPNNMDGVPGVTFPGIAPGQTFTYRLPMRQNGTYWFHSHASLQEQVGLYGPIVIDPADPDVVRYDREYVIMLSDWTFDDPMTLIAKLRKSDGYFNFDKLTVADYEKMAKTQGRHPSLFDHSAWARMRMDPTDLADVSAYAYTYLMNGRSPATNWTGLFKRGERVRLRVIGGAAMSIFDVRIPGLRMTVVQADGANIKPVTVDEFRIAPGETYDVIVQPTDDRAYTIFAESMDRSGYACGTLAPRAGMTAPVPRGRPRPMLSMADMGMAMTSMSDMDHTTNTPESAGSEIMPGMSMPSSEKGVGEMTMGGGSPEIMPVQSSTKAYPPGSMPIAHGPDTHGVENAMVPKYESNRLNDPGTGLENTGHRVLVYTDLHSLVAQADRREPDRALELHITGNMNRYMWSFDGKKYSETGALQIQKGEHVRLILVNDTMMEHPIHVHGMYMQLENGGGAHQPLKHTIRVKPAERISLILLPQISGDWIMHCHLLLHMELGMMRVFQVTA